MKIKKAAELLGMTPRNIRFYEETGLIVMGRSENGYRDYNEHDIERLRQIKVLRDLGISIEDIKRYFRKEISFNQLMEQREDELKSQKKDVESLLKLCEEIKKQDLPLSSYPTKVYDHLLNNRQITHPRENGKLLTSEWQTHHGKKWIMKIFGLLIFPMFLISIILVYDYMKLFNQEGWSSDNAPQIVFLTCVLMAVLIVVVGAKICRSNHFELHEEGVYFITRYSDVKMWKYFRGVLANDYLKYMEFIHYEDIKMVKAGVQEAGMIMGGNHLFTFYLVIFTWDDRAIRLDSDLFTGKNHFMTTLRILHDKSPKWIDPKHLAELLELPHEKAYKILDDYYWSKRPWHKEPIYQRFKKNNNKF